MSKHFYRVVCVDVSGGVWLSPEMAWISLLMTGKRRFGPHFDALSRQPQLIRATSEAAARAASHSQTAGRIGADSWEPTV